MAESSATPSHGNISALTSEEINYLRLSNLILRVAPTAVKTKFDYEFHPTVLQRTLNQNKMKVIEPLYKQRIINKTQWDLLFPVTGKGILLISKINMKTNTETSRHKPIHFIFKAIKRNTCFSQTSHLIRNSCNLCISTVNLFLSFTIY